MNVADKLQKLYDQLDRDEACLAEDIREGQSIGAEFYRQQIRKIRDEIDFLETAGEEWDKDRL